jgi:hypothetical protein
VSEANRICPEKAAIDAVPGAQGANCEMALPRHSRASGNPGVEFPSGQKMGPRFRGDDGNLTVPLTTRSGNLENSNTYIGTIT